MRKTIIVLLMAGRLLGVTLVVIGLWIWITGATDAVSIHVPIGFLFVLVVWSVALIGLFALPKRGVPLVALLWGALVLWFGMAQTSLLVGSGHWAVRLAHLLVGGAAIGLVERIGGAAKRHLAANAAP